MSDLSAASTWQELADRLGARPGADDGAAGIPEALAMDVDHFDPGEKPPSVLRERIMAGPTPDGARLVCDIPAMWAHFGGSRDGILRAGSFAGWYRAPAVTLSVMLRRRPLLHGGSWQASDHISILRVFGAKVNAHRTYFDRDRPCRMNGIDIAATLLLNNIFGDNHLCTGEMDVGYLTHVPAQRSPAGLGAVPTAPMLRQFWSDFLAAPPNGDLSHSDEWVRPRLRDVGMTELAARFPQRRPRSWYEFYFIQREFLALYCRDLFDLDARGLDDPADRAVTGPLLDRFWDLLLNGGPGAFDPGDPMGAGRAAAPKAPADDGGGEAAGRRLEGTLTDLFVSRMRDPYGRADGGWVRGLLDEDGEDHPGALGIGTLNALALRMPRPGPDGEPDPHAEPINGLAPTHQGETLGEAVHDLASRLVDSAAPMTAGDLISLIDDLRNDDGIVLHHGMAGMDMALLCPAGDAGDRQD